MVSCAVVAGDDHGRLLGGRGRETRRTEVVAVPHAMRHERHHPRARRPQRPRQQCGRALPVHVVIAVHQDPLPRPHGGGDQLDRPGHVRQVHGIGQRIETGAQEGGGRVGCLVPALQQQRGQRRRQVERAAQATHPLRLGLRANDPPSGQPHYSAAW
jgi:hypothetical protein